MLGNSRFLIIVISVLTAVALICLGASAREIDDDFDLRDSLDDSYFRSVPDNSVGYPYDVIFNPEPSEPASGMSVSFSCNGVTYGSIGVGDHEGHSWLYFWGSGGIGFLYVYDFDSSVWASDSYRYITLNSMPPVSARAWLSSNCYVSPLSSVPSFFSTVLSVGNSLVSFVMSSWVVLVPVVAFVAILGFGVIRRLVKGV